MRIVIGVDGTEAAEIACRFVAGRAWPAGTSVELVSAYDVPTDLAGLAPIAVQSPEDQREHLAMASEEQAALFRRCGLTVMTSVQRGPPAEVLRKRAQESFAQLIVVGSRGLGPIAAAMLGSVSAHLVDHAPCPVLVARSPGATRMLLATDGTESSRTVPRVMASWGNAFRGLPVEVLSVAARLALIPAPGRLGGAGHDDDVALHERIAEQVADEMTELGWDAAAFASIGDPEREILAAASAWRADLIVTGSRGLGTLRRLVVGSVSHDLLMHSHSSLLVVRGNVPAPIGRVVSAAAAPVL